MNFQDWKNKVLQTLGQIGLDVKGKQDKLLFDGEFYIDENGNLRNNISDYVHEETWNIGDSQTFTLPFEPTKFNGVNVFPGTRLHSSQYTLIPPNQVEILDPLTDGDIIEFDFQHFINAPE